MRISEEYRNLNAGLHEADVTWGITPMGDVDNVKDLIKQGSFKSIVDYGCGKGRLGRVLPGIKVHSYDPCVPEFSSPPPPAERVVCTAVLEHVEPELIDNVLDDIKRLAKKAVFLKVDTQPSKYSLPDGTNIHRIQEEFDWWAPKLMGRWKVHQVNVVGRKFYFIGIKR